MKTLILLMLIFSSKLDFQMKTSLQDKNKKAPADHATGALALEYEITSS
jgi:hypothetical protein